MLKLLSLIAILLSITLSTSRMLIPSANTISVRLENCTYDRSGIEPKSGY